LTAQQEGERLAALEAAERDVKTFRLCVRGVHPSVSAADLQARLAPFGRVEKMELQVGRGFAYVDLETTARAIAKCQSVYSNTTWRGMQLRVAGARPVFRAKLVAEHLAAKKRAKRAAYRLRRAEALLTAPPPVTAAETAVLLARKGWFVGPNNIPLAAMKVRAPSGRFVLTKRAARGELRTFAADASDRSLPFDQLTRSASPLPKLVRSIGDDGDLFADARGGDVAGDHVEGEDSASQDNDEDDEIDDDEIYDDGDDDKIEDDGEEDKDDDDDLFAGVDLSRLRANLPQNIRIATAATKAAADAKRLKKQAEEEAAVEAEALAQQKREAEIKAKAEEKEKKRLEKEARLASNTPLAVFDFESVEVRQTDGRR
jgi:hypothetical protein